MMKILVNVSYTHSAFLFFFKKAVSYWYNIDKLTDGTFSHQFSSDAQSCLTICDPMDCSMQGFPVHLQLPKLAQTHIHQVGDAIQPSCPLSSPSPPVFNLSQHQGPFQWINSLHKVAKVLEFQLISFRIDWFDFLVVQGTLKSLQHQGSKESILQLSAFFINTCWNVRIGQVPENFGWEVC